MDWRRRLNVDVAAWSTSASSLAGLCLAPTYVGSRTSRLLSLRWLNADNDHTKQMMLVAYQRLLSTVIRQSSGVQVPPNIQETIVSAQKVAA
jgi:hypothetical protein